MNNKIIGFTVSKQPISHKDIDVFNVGLKLKTIEKNNFNIYLWGIGDLDKCYLDSKRISLSFPLHTSLKDRNILIHFKNKDIIIENDWLGSIPVFYNKKEIIVSTLSLKTLKNKEIHVEGLANFVEFGYSALEQTPFKDVKFMRYFSKLVVNQQGITVVYKQDPILNKETFNKVEDEKIVFEKIKDYVNHVEDITEDEIILSTSGGYDSRLLNLCVNKKSRIRSFTYGISDNQSKSFEVVYAKKVCKTLGIQWEQIELGEFNRYVKGWFKLFGISTHLHGMYHIEFYKKILENHSFGGNATFLSAIIGDGWSGNVTCGKITNYNEIIKLAYSHGINAGKTQLLIPLDHKLKKQFFEENKIYLENEKIRITFLLRVKLILLSYLTIVPEYFGFPIWTPFLNLDIAIGMLNLSKERRQKRIWQEDIFKKYNLDIESMNLPRDNSNTLNYEAYMNHHFEPLDIQILSPYFKKSHLESINKIIFRKPSRLQEALRRIISNRYMKFALKLLGIKYRRYKDILIAYPYYITKTIEMGLKS